MILRPVSGLGQHVRQLSVTWSLTTRPPQTHYESVQSVSTIASYPLEEVAYLVPPSVVEQLTNKRTDLFCIYKTRLSSAKHSLSEYSPSLGQFLLWTTAPNSASSFYTSLPNSAVRGPQKPHISIIYTTNRVLCRVTRPCTGIYLCPFSTPNTAS